MQVFTEQKTVKKGWLKPEVIARDLNGG